MLHKLILGGSALLSNLLNAETLDGEGLGDDLEAAGWKLLLFKGLKLRFFIEPDIG